MLTEKGLSRILFDAISTAIMSSPDVEDALRGLRSLGLELESLDLSAGLGRTSLCPHETEPNFLLKHRIIPGQQRHGRRSPVSMEPLPRLRKR